MFAGVWGAREESKSIAEVTGTIHLHYSFELATFQREYI